MDEVRRAGDARVAAPAADAGAPRQGTAGPTRPRVVAGLRLVRLVGHGGEGEVWAARTGNGEARALKLIRPDALVDPAEVERRGRWLRAVDHPALVAVRRTGLLSGGGLDGWAFVEMPFLDGPSLEHAPADPDVLDRLEPLAEALDALHAGVWSGGVPLVHRDVKPANLIDVGGALVLVDHSTLRDAAAETVTRIGTPVFAAPEVPLGRAGPPADVYAFAATAVALRTGARGGALAALLDAPADLDVPAGLRAGLAPDPRERPSSCRAVLDADTPVPVALPGGAGADRQPGGSWAHSVPAPVWRWLVVLAGLVVAPLGVLALGRPLWPDVAAVTAGAAVVHLLAHAVADGPRVMAVLAPPLAWAWLLAERAVPTPRRAAYARAVLAGGFVAATGGIGWALVEGERAVPLGVAVLGLVVAAAAVVVARRGGLFLQLLLLPVCVAGAALLVVGAVALSPLALLVGRARACLRLSWETLAGVVEALRRPMAPPAAGR